MSAAAPRAHIDLSEPYSVRFHQTGKPNAGFPLCGTVERVQMRRFRARPKHRLPCEP